MAFKEKEMKLRRIIEAIRDKSDQHMENHSEVASELERWKKGVKITNVKVKKVI